MGGSEIHQLMHYLTPGTMSLRLTIRPRKLSGVAADLKNYKKRSLARKRRRGRRRETSRTQEMAHTNIADKTRDHGQRTEGKRIRSLTARRRQREINPPITAHIPGGSNWPQKYSREQILVSNTTIKRPLPLPSTTKQLYN
jgi:hypothetical protein